MTVDMQRYEELLQKFSETCCNSIDQETLDKLKIEYKEKINSKRVLENIGNLNSLLKVLEKRGVLQHDNIEVLHDIAKFIQDQSVDDLILSYEHWFTEHPTEINDLYNFGKSSNIIVNSEHISNEYKTSNFCDILHQNVPNIKSEDYCNESLLSKESDASFNSQGFIQKYSKKCKQKYIIVIIILLIILTISVIGTFVKISYLSTAIVPEAEQNTSENQFEAKMPLSMPNDNVRFSTNLSPTYTSTTTVRALDREKELQNIVVNKISRKIGIYWAEVIRRLDIEEANVDDIENRYIGTPQSYEKMFKEALKIYFSEEHPNWKKDLMKALEASKRKDLKEEVEKIVYY